VPHGSNLRHVAHRSALSSEIVRNVHREQSRSGGSDWITGEGWVLTTTHWLVQNFTLQQQKQQASPPLWMTCFIRANHETVEFFKERVKVYDDDEGDGERGDIDSDTLSRVYRCPPLCPRVEWAPGDDR
jgi:hypothetical protein